MSYDIDPTQAIKYLRAEKLLVNLKPTIESFADEFRLELEEAKKVKPGRLLTNYEKEEISDIYHLSHLDEINEKIFCLVYISATTEGKKMKIGYAAWNTRYEMQNGVANKVKRSKSKVIGVGDKKYLDITEFTSALRKACEQATSWKLEDLVEVQH